MMSAACLKREKVTPKTFTVAAATGDEHSVDAGLSVARARSREHRFEPGCLRNYDGAPLSPADLQCPVSDRELPDLSPGQRDEILATQAGYDR